MQGDETKPERPTTATGSGEQHVATAELVSAHNALQPPSTTAGAGASLRARGTSTAGSKPRKKRSVSMSKAARAQLPRPDSTILPCPRCGAGPEHTRFAYFNNRRTDQPRYFCRVCCALLTLAGAA
jgi:hypothetical protein